MKTVLAALVAILVGVSTHAADWPVFRGDAALTGVGEGELALPLKLLWRFETGDDVRATPVIGDGVVYVGSTDKKLYALDQVKGTQRWVYEATDSIEGSALLVSNLVVVGDLEGVLHAVDAKSGAKRWTLKVDDRIVGAPNLVDTLTPPRIVFGSYDNKLRCVSLAGTPVWEFETESYINGAPAVAGDCVMAAGCDANLYVLRAGDGTLLKSVEVGSYVAASPAAIAGVAVMGDFDGKLTAVNLTSYQVAWTYDGGDGAPFFSSPAGSGSFVIVGGRDGRVHAVNTEDGARRWTFKTGGDVDSSPVICGGTVLFGSRDGRVYAVGLEDGRELWSYEIGAAIVGAPAVANGIVVIGAEDGAVYAFGKR